MKIEDKKPEEEKEKPKPKPRKKRRLDPAQPTIEHRDPLCMKTR